ncbi:M99 family carboxypeptidase catalytic domain-containing protein [uncultured Desulfobacter sp.]|uniref:M14 family metallopeptidase n=1 Tax=uncultured Desulfobacter sp. TaxID=240139 RepID=UPI002AAB5420|nr:M99 family carboxypeptidase catalytic domain-containing protein [uncultured Desulfobacter sp.]
MSALGGIVFLWLAGSAFASQSGLGFSVHTLASHVPGKTALIVGGIQGDEPGGFNAAALIATRYKIISGQVIVVPNLNFESIIKRSRGVYGDMNRKFDQVSKTDPERQIIDKIKSMITDPGVDFILNLHDGSGFFMPIRESDMRNPDRWGQSIIIDQARMPSKYSGLFCDLAAAARQCAADINTHVINSDDTVHVRNTRTAQGDAEMAKTLTFFAMKNEKPAFGIEASKSFPTPDRVYYHLLAIESFLKQAGIFFQRDFSLTNNEISKAIDKDIALTLGERRILLYAENIRKHIYFLPMEKDGELNFMGNNPLLALVHNESAFDLYHGNRCLSRLSPQYFEYDLGIDHLEIEIDGRKKQVPFGSRIQVKKQFLVHPIPDHRVNIIGYSKQDITDEAGVLITRNDCMQRFSIDRDGSIFRIEVYSQGKFNGMVLADFRPGNTTSDMVGTINDIK